MCLHCQGVLEPFRQVCPSCNCDYCGVRPIKVFERDDMLPKTYIMYRQGSAIWVAEWNFDGLQEYEVHM
jgi:hypothetical protein